ncbi:MAG: hypothetical protein HYW22_02850 [Candidatus Aenigmarchaeota archaeon]|nr:hypothetical protein [Candidatus Aenigmarchaeota archaeon]
MPRPSIMLAEQELPLGVRVHAYQHGNDEPLQTLPNGKPFVLIKLFGEPPIKGKRLYHIEDDHVRVGFEGFSDGVRFSPVSVYSVQDAPAGDVYFAFTNGAKAVHDRGHSNIHDYNVVKSDDGKFYEACDVPMKFISYGRVDPELKERPLPKGLDETPDSKLIDLYNKVAKIPDTTKKSNPQFDIFTCLALKHRHSYLELIPLLQQLEGFLVEASLPTNTELVPYEGVDHTYYFERVMSTRETVQL